MVIGLDGCRKGWVGVKLDANGRFHSARHLRRLDPGRDWLSSAKVVGIDMPLRLLEAPRREADREARRFLGAERGRSVFPAPPAFMLEPEWARQGYAAVNAESKRRHGIGIPKQAFMLRESIAAANAFSGQREGVVEVHPELSFAMMGKGAARFPKKSWGGFRERMALLEEHGIELPAELPDGISALPADDLLDAAAAAWTARRVALRIARAFPDDSEARILA